MAAHIETAGATAPATARVGSQPARATAHMLAHAYADLVAALGSVERLASIDLVLAIAIAKAAAREHNMVGGELADLLDRLMVASRNARGA